MAPIHPETGEPAAGAMRAAQLGNRSLALEATVSAGGDVFISRATAHSQVYLLEVDPVTGRAKGDPTSDFPEYSGSPHWSLDGEWVAYRTSTDGLPRGVSLQHVVERNIRTGEERLAKDKVAKAAIAPRPWYYSEPASAGWVVYAETSRAPTTPPAPIVAAPWAVYAQTWTASKTIYRKDLASGQTDILHETEEPISQLLAFDDGREILFSTYSAGRDRHTLQVFDVGNRIVRKLGVTRGQPQWAISPDGREIAVVDLNCLIVLQRAGGEPHELVCVSPPRLPLPGTYRGNLIQFTWWTDLTPSWSPDGKKIAWAVTVEEKRRVELQIVDRFTGAVELAWAGEEDFYSLPRQPHWSPDGSKIAFSMQQYHGHELWALRGLIR
jgi:Tol biopolymer transport system component